jgi:4-amino-4-deoxy-L-arabinose transferase-like glycosyltransferase
MTWLKQHRWALAALFAGLLLRLYFILRHADIAGDSLIYGDLATNILKHHIYGFTEDTIRSTLIRLPGYPLFLAACFRIFGMGNYTAALYIQLILDLISCWLLGALGRRLMGARAGLCAIWLAALCPFTANYVAAPLTEPLAIFCAALAFYSLQRWASSTSHKRVWIWPIGLALAFAILLRPDRALLAAAIVPAMAFLAFRSPTNLRNRSLLQTGIVALIIVLPLAAWTTRNWRTFHTFQPLAPKYANDPGEFVSYGFYRWYRTWGIDFKSTVDIYWTWDGSPMSLADLPPRAFDSAAQRTQTAAIFDAYNEVSAATPAVDRQFATLAAERIAAHPFRSYVELPSLRVADMWLRPRTEMLPAPMDWWRFRDHPRASIWTAAYAALNLAYLTLAAAGLQRIKSFFTPPQERVPHSSHSTPRDGWGRQQLTRQTLTYALTGFVLLRSAMLLTVDNSEPRYTIDCYPVIILLAAFAFTKPTAQPPSSSCLF